MGTGASAHHDESARKSLMAAATPRDHDTVDAMAISDLALARKIIQQQQAELQQLRRQAQTLLDTGGANGGGGGGAAANGFFESAERKAGEKRSAIFNKEQPVDESVPIKTYEKSEGVRELLHKIISENTLFKACSQEKEVGGGPGAPVVDVCPRSIDPRERAPERIWGVCVWCAPLGSIASPSSARERASSRTVAFFWCFDFLFQRERTRERGGKTAVVLHV
jgi:hypothetical protein